MLFRCGGILALAVLFTATTAHAQSTATLKGTVSDTHGTVMPGVTVVIHNQETGADRTVVTDAGGQYVATGLAPGRYHVEAELRGFQTQGQDAVLEVGSTVLLNFRLAVGGVAPAVTEDPRWSFEASVGWDIGLTGDFLAAGIGSVNGVPVVIQTQSFNKVYGTGVLWQFGAGNKLNDDGEARAQFTYQRSGADAILAGRAGASDLFATFDNYEVWSIEGGYRRYFEHRGKVRPVRRSDDRHRRHPENQRHLRCDAGQSGEFQRRSLRWHRRVHIRGERWSALPT